MIPVQGLSVLFGLAMLYVARIHFRKRHLTKLEFSLWLSVWLGFIFLAFFPQLVSGIAQRLHIARVFDLLVIAALMILTVLTYINRIAQRQVQQKVMALVRERAIAHVLQSREKKETRIRDAVVVVTGGHGFLGRYVVAELKKEHPKKILVPRSKDYDLRDPQACARLFAGADIVIHLAARVGGIGLNQKEPGSLFYDNILMGTHALHEAYKAGVKKFVSIGTICAYPKYTPVPFREEDLWNGYPEETNAPYGLAKKMQLVQAQSYRQQYGFDAVHLLPVNLYGPGDNFDPETSHVIPALIRKFVEAKEKRKSSVTLWGTGQATREFLFVRDAAKGIVLATKWYSGVEPVNLGSSFEISIADLAKKIQEIVGYKGETFYDASKPDGQPRRKLDTTRAVMEFGFRSETSFAEGLAETIRWYKESRHGKKPSRRS